MYVSFRLPVWSNAVTKITRLFADDCLLYRIIDGLEDQVQLQSDLRELEQWAADWGMQFNPSKCHVLSANKRSHRHQYFY